MRTVIEGGWVVAWNGKSHEVHEQGSVVFEGDRVVHAGPAWTGTADARIAARGKLVSPGFINTHVHTAGGGGDYLLLDMAKNDYRTANYMAFAAPLKGKMAPPPAEPTAAIRAFTFLHALKNGTTTVIDVGGLRGDWEGYARLVDDLGVRVYGGPPFRDRDTYTDAQGRLYYDEDAAAGRTRLQEAVDFGRKFDGAAGGRLRVLFNAAQVETCSEPLLRAGKDAARAQNAPIHTHAGGNLVEFQRIMDEYRKTPIRFLADIGFLDDRTLLGHAVFTTAHDWARYPFGDDLAVLAERGATVGHCPYKYAKMAMTLHSFQRYLDAGVTLALGTDTYPLDMVSELRWASILAKVTDANYQAGLARDVFNAATIGGCRFLGREDLGRLAPGAKADILLINLDHVGGSLYADPIKALVDSASRPRRGHRDRGRPGAGAGRARHARGRGRGVREGARGHPALLEPRAVVAVGRRHRGPDRPARVSHPPGARVRRSLALGLLLVLAVCARPGAGPGRARGHRDLGRARLAGAHVLRSRRGHRDRAAPDGLLRDPRRPRAPAARHRDGGGARHVVDGEPRRPRLRVRAAQGRHLPQRRPADRGGREVHVRALPRAPARACSRRRWPRWRWWIPHRVRFRLKQPWPDFMTFYATPATGAAWIVPKKYVERVGDEGFKKAPVGAGPYKFVSFKPGVELVMEAHEGYWRKPPIVKTLVFKVIPDDATRLAALKRGEVDIAYGLVGELAEEVRRTPGLKLKAAQIPVTLWLVFADQNDPKSPWADRRVRLAANLAINRKAVNEASYLGLGKISASIIPQSLEYYWAPPPYPSRPGRARGACSRRRGTRRASTRASCRASRSRPRASASR